VSVENERDLRERLDRAFGAIVPAAAPVISPGGYTVTVQPPGPHAPAGLIASGTMVASSG